MNKALLRLFSWVILGVAIVLILYPLYQLLILSLRPVDDITAYISQIENRALRFIPGYFIPNAFSLEQYALTMTDTFLRAYFVAILYTISITVMHFPVALVLGFVFSKTHFKGRNPLFFLFLAAMVLPFHVTLVPMHQILSHLQLFDTPWAVILPSVFSPLGVFLVRQFFRQIPNEVLEAASIDGAGLLRTIISIMIPMARHGLAMFFLLTLALQWSAIEPALAFIRSDEWKPISITLRAQMENSTAQIFAPSVLYIIPMIILFKITSQNKPEL